MQRVATLNDQCFNFDWKCVVVFTCMWNVCTIYLISKKENILKAVVKWHICTCHSDIVHILPIIQTACLHGRISEHLVSEFTFFQVSSSQSSIFRILPSTYFAANADTILLLGVEIVPRATIPSLLITFKEDTTVAK